MRHILQFSFIFSQLFVLARSCDLEAKVKSEHTLYFLTGREFRPVMTKQCMIPFLQWVAEQLKQNKSAEHLASFIYVFYLKTSKSGGVRVLPGTCYDFEEAVGRFAQELLIEPVDGVVFNDVFWDVTEAKKILLHPAGKEHAATLKVREECLLTRFTQDEMKQVEAIYIRMFGSTTIAEDFACIMFLVLFTTWYKKLVIVICGVANAGKSTLFKLLRAFVLIVSQTKFVRAEGSTGKLNAHMIRTSRKPVLLHDDVRASTKLSGEKILSESGSATVQVEVPGGGTEPYSVDNRKVVTFLTNAEYLNIAGKGDESAMEPFLARFAVFECVNTVEKQDPKRAKEHAKEYGQAHLRYFWETWHKLSSRRNGQTRWIDCVSEETLEKSQSFVRRVDRVINFVHQRIAYRKGQRVHALHLWGLLRSSSMDNDSKEMKWEDFLDHLTIKGDFSLEEYHIKNYELK